MTVERAVSRMKTFVSNNKGNMVVIGTFILGYISLVIVMGSIRPIAFVTSDSMLPTLRRGDLILVKGVKNEELEVGEVIVFQAPKSPSLVVHRVKRRWVDEGKVYYQTKGDNNPISDPYDVPARDVIGKYVGVKIPIIGFVFQFITSPVGLILIMILVIVLSMYESNYSKKFATYKKGKRIASKNPQEQQSMCLFLEFLSYLETIIADPLILLWGNLNLLLPLRFFKKDSEIDIFR